MNDNDRTPPGKPPRRPPWNKGKLIGAKPPLQAEPRLVDPDQAADRGAHARPGAVQPRHRQQAARLRRRRDQRR